MHKILGEAVDTLCFILILAGALFLFSYYWSDAYQLDYVEHLIHGFFDEAERKQEITAEEYEGLLGLLAGVNENYTVEIEVKRDNTIYYQEELWNILLTEERFVLEGGDFVSICVSKGRVKRTIMFTTIWW